MQLEGTGLCPCSRQCLDFGSRCNLSRAPGCVPGPQQLQHACLPDLLSLGAERHSCAADRAAAGARQTC